MSAIEPVIALADVTYAYPGQDRPVPVLDSVSLVVERDDFLGLIGPNGGGKTTLLKIILGILRPTSGKVRVLGRPPREKSRVIGYVPQHAKIDSNVPATVLDVVLTGRISRTPWGFHYREAHVEKALDAMEKSGVQDLRDRPLGALSGGQRQRVLIARALASDAQILCLDEPMAGVDVAMEKGILDLLHLLNEKMPIILVSHDLGFVSTHVNRVACLDRRLVVHRPEEITHEIIAKMYHAHGSVHSIRHNASCPIDHGRHGPPGKEEE